ncbi:MAG: N-acetylmuramoyl-L-alanine amidase [Peptostreptococcaceae bacterium]|nr:N-acetylmuramoyl-L-alanine amidase [Peptostreptococcaceae bacterium]
MGGTVKRSVLHRDSQGEEGGILRTDFQYEYPLVPLDKNRVCRLILHHAAAKTASAEEIHSWHRAKGFGGFGYNEYVRKDGSVIIGRGGRIGAHCKDQNALAYGICAEGDYEIEKSMPDAQRASLIRRIRNAFSLYPKIHELRKHSDFRPTSCPGRYFPFEQILEELRRQMQGEILEFSEKERLQAIERLSQKGIITDPAYWQRKAGSGEYVRGEYAARLICRTAQLLE